MNPFVADPAWGWWIVFYFFLGGLAAGCYFLATLIELFGQAEDRPLARIGYRVSFPLVCVCAVLLIVDLDRPERFWHMALQSEMVNQGFADGWPLGGWGNMAQAVMLKWWSPMSIGAQALGVFGLCSLLSLIGTLRPKGWLARMLDSHVVGRTFKVIGSAAGFFVAAYTGALLTATNQPLWSATDWIAPLFLTSAASTGIALLLLLGGRISEGSRERLERADLWALGLELFIFLIFLASLRGVLPLALATWEGLALVVGTLVLGLLAPLWLHLGFRTPSAGRIIVAAVSCLAGGFLLRFGVVWVAPALLHKFPKITAEVIDIPLWQSWEGKVLLAVTLALAVLIPYALSRRWQLARGQTMVAGVMSLLAMAVVGFYAVTPLSAHTAIDPLGTIFVSPEDQRPRGGGPGASASNQPAEPALRGKIGEAAP